jgi:hypothetical protein
MIPTGRPSRLEPVVQRDLSTILSGSAGELARDRIYAPASSCRTHTERTNLVFYDRRRQPNADLRHAAAIWYGTAHK